MAGNQPGTGTSDTGQHHWPLAGSPDSTNGTPPERRTRKSTGPLPTFVVVTVTGLATHPGSAGPSTIPPEARQPKAARRLRHRQCPSNRNRLNPRCRHPRPQSHASVAVNDDISRIRPNRRNPAHRDRRRHFFKTSVIGHVRNLNIGILKPTSSQESRSTSSRPESVPESGWIVTSGIAESSIASTPDTPAAACRERGHNQNRKNSLPCHESPRGRPAFDRSTKALGYRWPEC